MTIPIAKQAIKSIKASLKDVSLTKKASLNVVAAGLDYVARILVGFLVTPLLVYGLGEFFFGMWQILNRVLGYFSRAVFRPTQALKSKLATEKNSQDYEQKRKYVGSTFIIWLIFLPFVLAFGGVLAWFGPIWLKVPQEYIGEVRLAGVLLIVNLAIANLVALPQAVLEGENLGYKRMGISVSLVLIGGGLTWLAMAFDTGLAGVVVAALSTTAITGAFFFWIVRSYTTWFGFCKPSFDLVRQFFGLSGWFMAWNIIINLMMTMDVILLGRLFSVESVTSYSLTKYVPDTLVGIVDILVFGAAPGLGSIIGSGDLKKAADVRGEIFSINWLVLVVIGITILLWNRSFLALWVGEENYLGASVSLLVILMVIQFVLIKNDGTIIDLTLRLHNKVLLGSMSLVVAFAFAIIFVSHFKLGVFGLCLGIILGRLLLSFGYPILVGHYLQVRFVDQLHSALRPIFATFLLMALAFVCNHYLLDRGFSFANHWLGLIISVGFSVVVISILAFYTGFTTEQRRRILARFRKAILPVTNEPAPKLSINL